MAEQFSRPRGEKKEGLSSKCQGRLQEMGNFYLFETYMQNMRFPYTACENGLVK